MYKEYTVKLYKVYCLSIESEIIIKLRHRFFEDLLVSCVIFYRSAGSSHSLLTNRQIPLLNNRLSSSASCVRLCALIAHGRGWLCCGMSCGCLCGGIGRGWLCGVVVVMCCGWWYGSYHNLHTLSVYDPLNNTSTVP